MHTRDSDADATDILYRKLSKNKCTGDYFIKVHGILEQDCLTTADCNRLPTSIYTKLIDNGRFDLLQSIVYSTFKFTRLTNMQHLFGNNKYSQINDSESQRQLRFQLLLFAYAHAGWHLDSDNRIPHLIQATLSPYDLSQTRAILLGLAAGGHIHLIQQFADEYSYNKDIYFNPLNPPMLDLSLEIIERYKVFANENSKIMLALMDTIRKIKKKSQLIILLEKTLMRELLSYSVHTLTVCQQHVIEKTDDLMKELIKVSNLMNRPASFSNFYRTFYHRLTSVLDNLEIESVATWRPIESNELTQFVLLFKKLLIKHEVGVFDEIKKTYSNRSEKTRINDIYSVLYAAYQEYRDQLRGYQLFIAESIILQSTNPDYAQMQVDQRIKYMPTLGALCRRIEPQLVGHKFDSAALAALCPYDENREETVRIMFANRDRLNGHLSDLANNKLCITELLTKINETSIDAELNKYAHDKSLASNAVEKIRVSQELMLALILSIDSMQLSLFKAIQSHSHLFISIDYKNILIKFLYQDKMTKKTYEKIIVRLQAVLPHTKSNQETLFLTYLIDLASFNLAIHQFVKRIIELFNTLVLPATQHLSTIKQVGMFISNNRQVNVSTLITAADQFSRRIGTYKNRTLFSLIDFIAVYNNLRISLIESAVNSSSTNLSGQTRSLHNHCFISCNGISFVAIHESIKAEIYSKLNLTPPDLLSVDAPVISSAALAAAPASTVVSAADAVQSNADNVANQPRRRF